MKKGTQKQAKEEDMRKEYDFRKMKSGIRGKYYQAYRAGHTVKIHKADGSTVERHT